MLRNTSLLYYILFICIGILYPAYCSLFALQTPDKKDDNLWLIYWVVFAVFNVFEILTDFVFSWLPFYPVLKPIFRMYGGHVDLVLTHAVETAKNVAQQIPPYPQ
ncbi:receptor expression-enhancing protein [Caerostris extrusa]|uniref:Receptor expression-enhancing protein n=1 Tax=Caerostris extrusa TaxID=172846 RepID=A0AAV4UDR6_CAEEX|nr:receptor expression-enhancing protein [Caerostris extrusa]